LRAAVLEGWQAGDVNDEPELWSGNLHYV
jgi:hypothetical protein